MTKIYGLYLLLALIFIWAIPQISSDKVKVVSLNNWSIRNENNTIRILNTRPPVGVYNALKSKFGDVLDSKNDEDLRWIARENWTFTANFSVSLDRHQMVNLTFHGIDTVATIRLNNHTIGRTDNMFVRYSFDVSSILLADNYLEVHFKSPISVAKKRAEMLKKKGINAPPDCPNVIEKGECHRNMLRKMQMSFGGDWNLAAPSIGLWKSVDLEYYEVAIMRDVDVAIRRNDTHWTLDIKVFLSTGTKENFYGELTFIAAELLDEPSIQSKRLIAYAVPTIEFEVNIPKERVEMWWPNGYGQQKLYPLYFTAQCWKEASGPRMDSRTKSQKTINIGFRTIELEEDLDDYGRSFYFKVNGQPIFVRGANYVPSHILPELSYQESRVEHLIKSAKATHLNMIRVWGGGLYEADSFYNLTDIYGILVWQDMTFTSATYPMTNELVESVRKETSQNARRLAYHPSLCMLVTNDEIELYLTKNKTEFGSDSQRLEDEYKQLFMGTIRHELNVISRNDFNPRAGPMISTPSMGVEESKKDLSTEPQSPNYGDVHFWDDEKDAWDPDIYPRARFITEYGFQSLPILSSWNRTLYPEDNLTAIVRHRQHDPKAFIPMLTLITKHFAIPSMTLMKNVDILIYLSQISQAMALKTATDLFRSQRAHKRTMGAMYWQLNDAWVAPTWSSIDYFGNYKVAWYWSKQFMAPTSVIALIDAQNDRINVTVTKEEFVNDIEQPQKYNITMYTYLWSALYHRKSLKYEISVASNGIYTKYIDMSSVFNSIFTRNNCFMKFVLTQNDTILSSTHLFPGKLYQSIGMADPRIEIDLSTYKCIDKKGPRVYYSITLTVQKPALFVYIEIYHENVEKYSLSENGFVLTDPIRVVNVELDSKDGSCVELSKEHVKVFTVNQQLVPVTKPNGFHQTAKKTSTMTEETPSMAETVTSVPLNVMSSEEGL